MEKADSDRGVRDVFVSHAWEDKDAIARPLATELRSRGLSVWFDEFELAPGDSLRRRISDGLTHARVGVVILSRAFFAKEWTQWELDGLNARQIAGVAGLIFPVWHEIELDDVVGFSPPLADVVAARSSDGVPAIADAVVLVIGRVTAQEPEVTPARKRPSAGRADQPAAQQPPADAKTRGSATQPSPLRVFRGLLRASMATGHSSWMQERNYPDGEPHHRPLPVVGRDTLPPRDTVERICPHHGGYIRLAVCPVLATSSRFNEDAVRRARWERNARLDVMVSGPAADDPAPHPRALPVSRASVGGLVRSHIDERERVLLALPTPPPLRRGRQVPRLRTAAQLAAGLGGLAARPVRACPKCQHPLPTTIDRCDAYLVALIGDARSSKTTTVLALTYIRE